MVETALDFKDQGRVECLVEKVLPTGESYDDWTVCVDHHCVKAYTLYTGYNKLGNKKYANFGISFEVANPADVRIDYMDNGIDVREWIEKNGIDSLVRDEVVVALRKIDRALAGYVSRAREEALV